MVDTAEQDAANQAHTIVTLCHLNKGKADSHCSMQTWRCLAVTFSGVPEVALALMHEVQVEACAEKSLAIGKRNDGIAVHLVISHTVANCITLKPTQSAFWIGHSICHNISSYALMCVCVNIPFRLAAEFFVTQLLGFTVCVNIPFRLAG